jgi:hypothetical protein
VSSFTALSDGLRAAASTGFPQSVWLTMGDLTKYAAIAALF